MVEYEIIFLKQAEKDKKLLKQANLETKTKELLDLISIDPFITPPFYETLQGNLDGCYSRRINLYHRLVYEVDKKNKIIYILRMWSHYEKL